MKYQVIARRYRPRRFEEVVGQEAVGTTLHHAILQDRLAHAYLFAGPRGVGKTSMARIFAKALNCPRASDRSRPKEEWGISCDECEVCRAIHAGDDLDVLEVDGASYRGIEDVRDIVEHVKFTPARSPYKVFIVDEVHMLTREAFNALLKTLEEPPAHVKFVFATTEPHKIPETVLSRCQRFDFRPIGEPETVKRLGQICKAEGVKVEAGLLEKIARYGKGGLRDAQTLLDQAITYSDGTLRAEELERITGRLPEEAVERLVARVLERDPPGTLRALEECFQAGADPAILLDQVVERLHLGLLESVKTGGPEGGLDLSLGRLQVLHETAVKLRGSPYPRLAVELALVKLARLEDPQALDQVLAYLKALESRVTQGGAAIPAAPARPAAAQPAGPAQAAGPAPLARPAGPGRKVREAGPEVQGDAAGSPPPAAAPSRGPQRRTARAAEPSASPAAAQPPLGAPAAPAAQPPLAAAAPPAAPPPAASRQPPAATGPPASPGGAEVPDFARVRSLWDQIVIECGERLPQVGVFLSRARLKEARDRGALTVILDSDFHLKQFREPRRLQAFTEVVREVTGAPWRVLLELEAAPPSGQAAPAGRPEAPPAREDPLIKKSVDLFKGKIV